MLKPFNKFTKHVSLGRPTITTSTSVYFSLSKLLKQAGNREGPYAEFPLAITRAVHGSLKRFDKYFTAMDRNITYYIASILDPRIKGAWIKKHHDDGEGKLKEVQETIHKIYLSNAPISKPNTTPLNIDNEDSISILQELISDVNQDNDQALRISDVDRYFNSPNIGGDPDGIDDPDWVLNWWKAHEKEYPIMSQVAQDYLPIAAAEVDVERLFSTGRDLIGLRRHSLSEETMKALMIMKHNQEYCI